MDKYFLTFPNGEKKLKTQEFLDEYKQTPNVSATTVEYSFEFDTKRDINIQIIEFLIIFETLEVYWKNLGYRTRFNLDYFPYGRADKETSEEKGSNGDINFAKVIAKMFESYNVIFNTIHNPKAIQDTSLDYLKSEEHTKKLVIEHINSFVNCHYDEEENEAFKNLIVFPDKGALQRFSPMFKNGGLCSNISIASLSKTRDTNDGSLKFDGKITTLLNEQLEDLSKYEHIVVIDDILSKGGTFLAVNDILKSKGARMQKVTYSVLYDEDTKPEDYPLHVFKVKPARSKWV